MALSVRKFLPHVLIIIGFIALSLAYFSPVLSGKQIFQSDIMQYIGMSKQQTDFRAATGEETYWTNSAFGGMPTYQLGALYPHNYIKKLDSVLRFLPRPADYLFLYFIGFYILLLTLKVDFRLAALGALAFGFSTYLIIILGVGHNSKAHAIAYMPLVLSGILLVFQKKYIFGFLLTTVAMALELSANHYQMTYYLMLLVLVLGAVYLYDAYKKKLVPHFFKSVGIMVVAVILAIGLNATNIMATQEYVKESTRGKSELTINPDGSTKAISNGLDRDYITEYSYGFLETFNLFIPRLLGGGNGEDVGRNSEMYKFYTSIGASPIEALREVKRTPTYWGNQPIVEAPAYVGAVVLFLFVFALFMVKGRLKWWLVGGVVMSLLLSYGKNLGFLTDFFIQYVPMYNKFRAVTSIQVILELCIPILAVFGLVRLFNDLEKRDHKLKALKLAAGISAGIAILFILFKGSFDFVGANDGYYRQAYGEYGQSFVDALKADRKAMFTYDTLRTLILVLLSSGGILLFLRKKLSENGLIIVFAALILIDLVGVDRRYVNSENFVPSLQVNKPYQANAADLEIMKDDGHFRVFDVTSSAARASYFHNSLSGYHAAKLGRYNELFDFHIAKNNMNVLNMLNTKYIIADDEKGNIFPYENVEANGNAWFISELEKVNSANEEMIALDSLDTKIKAVTTQEIPSSKFSTDASSTISIVEYKPNYLKYQSNNDFDGFAVFSEIYYADGWNAYIDGELQPHFRVDYVLRGLPIPKGQHTIEFKFEPQVVKTGSTIALASSILFGFLILGGIVILVRRPEPQDSRD
ncbi:YfhO family protein [Gelidibacter maritimus]|uniref:YfhO family protein n=1 Tax=Gelidibacter maritimus TaxID=2761487 RepID=A0A7W2M6P6_9FLAO|nr:YfhO family protein [Gelidibacter maritimus]MBA6153632.1 YfhO family protein [Gelidibacter maritimus]